MDTLTPAALAALRQDLLQRRQRLLQQLRQHLHQDSDDDQLLRFGAAVEDVGQAAADQLGETELAMLNHVLQQLRELEQALQRIADGQYGVCAGCGAAIAPARLQAQPEARLCLACQSARELHEFDRRQG